MLTRLMCCQTTGKRAADRNLPPNLQIMHIIHTIGHPDVHNSDILGKLKYFVEPYVTHTVSFVFCIVNKC